MEPLGRFAKMYLLFDRSECEEMLKHYIEAKVWREDLTKCVAVTQGDEAYP